MINRRKRTGRAPACFLAAAALLSAALAAPTALRAQSEFLDALGGPNDPVNLSWGQLADGSGGTMKTTSGSQGEFQSVEIQGRVDLRSSKLNLEANYLRYNGDTQELIAEGDVVVDQPEVQARSQRLRYDMATNSIVLTGNPEVEQRTPGRVGRFTGMERFVLTRPSGDLGPAEIRLEGGEEIKTQMSSGENPASAGEEGGFAGLGDVTITTRPLGDQDPVVIITTGGAAQAAAGEAQEQALGEFNARGSVLLESDDLRLQADQLDFNPEEQLVTALYNVYLKQGGIQAEAGRMDYEIVPDRITLTVDPVIRKEEPTQIQKISNLSQFVINRFPDGRSETQSQPAAGQKANIEFLPKSEAPAAAPNATPPPQEIRLDRTEDLDKIQ